MAALTKLEDKNIQNIRDCLKSCEADYIPIIVGGGRNSMMPQFNDFEIDLDKKEVTMKHNLSPVKQAEGIINRLEFAKTAFSDDERNLIVNYAFMLNDMDKTRELAEHIYYEETEGNQGAALAVIDAQAEIDALPDPMIGLWKMEEYGYSAEEMLPLTKETALKLFDRDLPVYQLYEDGSETLIQGREQVTEFEGIFGIEKADWENEKSLRALQEELAEGRANKETQLLYGDSDKYGIYQLKDIPEMRQFQFSGTESLKRRGIIKDNFDAIKPENYNLVYVGELSELQGRTQGATLEAVFEKFNIDHPADYKGHSLSVSDIVVLHEDGKNSAHFVDSFGFTGLLDFMRELEGVEEQEKGETEPEVSTEEMQDASGHDVNHSARQNDLKLDAEKAEQKNYTAVYAYGLNYAIEHGEADEYLDSRKLDRECKGAIEDAIRQNFGGMRLKHDIVKPLAEKYGSDRIAFVLANTLQQESWDGRFSRDNKVWAAEFSIPENIVRGMDMNHELVINSHPAVLDGFIDMFRREVLEQEKEVSAAQEKVQDTSGHDVQKLKPEQREQLETKQSEPQSEQDKPDKTQAFEDLDEEDEIIDLGDEKDQVLAQMKKSLKGEQETELAFQIADCFISIQEVDGGYDYSIMGADYKEIDGGVYDNPNVSIREALDDILADLRDYPFDNSVKGNTRDNDELIPIDYDGLMEKVEAANAIEPQAQGNVVDNFKAKTNELFHEISEMNPAEIEETVKCHVQAQLDEYGIDAEIVDVAVVGSRCRGLEQEGSDLDVVVELSTSEREDVLFDTFNGDALHIGGVKVDINPITAQRTGTLETYLPQVEDYLEGVREHETLAGSRTENIQTRLKEKETATLSQEQTETEVTLTVAECGEFHNLGEFYENIPTVEEAVAIWKQIPPERMNGIPAIGINIHTPGTEAFEDVGMDILTGKRIDLDILEYIPDIKGNPQAMEMIAELVAKLPEMEIDGNMDKEMEIKVWEKRMPDLEPAMQLAVELDSFAYHYDAFQHDSGFDSMDDSIPIVYDMLKDGQTGELEEWLKEVISEGAVPEDEERAKELLEKLAEYKPLAKIEEMEEQNYNMVDNVLNNGAGEKAQKEENKKAQDKPAAKPSLKARLAEKKAQVAGQGREQEENIKNKQREM